MRLVRFEDESGGFAVDLHPRVTVISGLPLHVRERLIHAFASLPSGSDPGGRGSLEVHGVYLDLNRDSLELLELDQPLDVVLTADDLPGVEAAPPDLSGRQGSPPSDDDARAGSGGSGAEAPVTEGQPAEELAALVETREQRESAYDTAESSLVDLRAQLAAVESERAELEAQLADSRLGLDADAAADVAKAKDDVAAIEEQLPAAASAVRAEIEDSAESAPQTVSAAADASEIVDPYRSDRDRIEARLSELIDEAQRLKRQLKTLRSIDTTPVQQAFDELEAATEASEGSNEPTEAPISPAAEALIAEWNELAQAQIAATARRAGGRSHLVDLTDRRDRAHDDLVAAKRALTSPELDPAVVEELETLHDEIFELDGRTSRFGAAKTRRRLEQLRDKERAVLGRLGFDTWSSYIIGNSNGADEPARLQRFEAAKAAFEFAEHELSRASTAPGAADPEAEELDRRRLDVQQRATAVLGFDPGPDPVEALSAHRPAVTSMVDAGRPRPEDAAAQLRIALEETGADMPARSMTARELRSLASGWLEAMDGLDERIADVTEDWEDIEAEIALLADKLASLPTPAPAPSPAPSPEPNPAPTESFSLEGPDGADESVSRDAELAAARERLEAHIARATLHEESTIAIAELEKRIDRLAARQIDLEASIAALSDELPILAAAAAEARTQLERAERANEESRTADVPGWSTPVGRTGGGEPLSPAIGLPSTQRSSVIGGSAGAEAIEWYVLARLAQQRSVSFVGSMPLVIDDAFRDWSIQSLADVFSRLERMGEVIQIVYLTDDPEVGRWALGLGSDKAMVLDMRVPA